MRLLPSLWVFFVYLSSGFAQVRFTSFEPLPPLPIEWDQTNTTYYTGQTIQLNWTSQNFLSTDLARIQYIGSGGTRTLTTGSGTPIQAGTYSVRLSDSSNGIVSNVPLTIAHATDTANSLVSSTSITIVQSKLMNIIALDGNRSLGSGQPTACDGRTLVLLWRGLGEAQFGSASILLRRQGGFLGTQTLATLTNIPVSGNTSVSIVCPRGTSPSTTNQYAFQLTINEPGGADYTGTSASFTVATASTPSPTPSQTPSPTISFSSSPSVSTSPSPSVTSSMSFTSSMTQTANPTIDYAALARAAVESADTTSSVIGGTVGGVGAVLLLLGLVKWYQNKLMTQKRLKRLQMSSRFARESQSMYGGSSSLSDYSPEQPSIVMYSVQGLQSRPSTQKGFAAKPTPK